MLYKSVIALLASTLLAGAASAAAEPMMNAQDPAGLYASLKDMGYAPDPVDTSMMADATKRVGLGRDAGVRALSALDIQVESITDVPGVPHGGVRPKKARRV